MKNVSKFYTHLYSQSDSLRTFLLYILVHFRFKKSILNLFKKFFTLFVFFVFSHFFKLVLNFQLPPPPPDLRNVSLFIFSTNQIRSSNRILHPASSHKISRQISKSFVQFLYIFNCFLNYFIWNNVVRVSKFLL